MKSFSEILAQVGCTDKNTLHTYGWVYDVLFDRYRYEADAVMEVGVCEFGGGSILAMARYFENAKVLGIDNCVNPCKPPVRNHPQILLLEGDAYDPDWMSASLRDLRFNVIIDDADHRIEQQVWLLRFLHRYLKPDGIYCIEDCVTEQWLPHLAELHSLGLQQTIFDMSSEQQPDNTLIVWRKK